MLRKFFETLEKEWPTHGINRHQLSIGMEALFEDDKADFTLTLMIQGKYSLIYRLNKDDINKPQQLIEYIKGGQQYRQFKRSAESRARRALEEAQKQLDELNGKEKGFNNADS